MNRGGGEGGCTAGSSYLPVGYFTDLFAIRVLFFFPRDTEDGEDVFVVVVGFRLEQYS